MSEEKANQRVEEFKREMKTLSVKLKEAEQRAEHAEKQVKRLQKEVDRLEGKVFHKTDVFFSVFLDEGVRNSLKKFLSGLLCFCILFLFFFCFVIYGAY